MDKKILVAHASKSGSTQEIAEKIGEVLRQAGLQVDVYPVERVRDLSPYGAVILGCAVYVGSWPNEAVTFFQAHERSLAVKPVWLFSSGPTGKGDPLAMLDGWRLPPAQQPVVDRIQPRDITVFHGNIDPDKVNAIEKWAVKSVVKKPFGDFRDWDTIVTWTNSIASALKNAAPS